MSASEWQIRVCEDYSRQLRSCLPRTEIADLPFRSSKSFIKYCMFVSCSPKENAILTTFKNLGIHKVQRFPGIKDHINSPLISRTFFNLVNRSFFQKIDRNILLRSYYDNQMSISQSKTLFPSSAAQSTTLVLLVPVSLKQFSFPLKVGTEKFFSLILGKIPSVTVDMSSEIVKSKMSISQNNISPLF